MDDIFIVGQSTTSKHEKVRLPSVQRSKKKFLNLSQNMIVDLADEPIDKRNLSFNTDLFDQLDSTRGLRKIISFKRNPTDLDDNSTCKDSLEIQGIVTPTHTRVLRPIIKKTSVYLGVAKKRKPLKLLAKIPPIINLKQEIFTYWADIIRSSNGVEVIPTLVGSYKYYIGKGNNGSLVNHILKTRFWWSRVDAPEQANLVWTQLKHKPTLDKMQGTENIENFLKKSFKKPHQLLLDQEKQYGISLIKDTNCFSHIEASLVLQSETLTMHNRLPNNFHICNKKSLFKNLKEYYSSMNQNAFDKIPLTFHIEQGTSDPAFVDFRAQHTEGSLWIIKPGEATNRGNGIKVSNDLSEITEILSTLSQGRTYILQKYIEKPLLINKRKFDIRCYALITSVNGHLQGYFYKEGYLRTASKEFSLKSVHDKFVHLTNDAIQKNSEDYGKFEAGNKLSYNDFQKFLAANFPEVSFDEIHMQIMNAVKDSIVAVKDILMNQKKSLNFEVFGYDFMVDSEFRVWLIEVNTNPCLELSCAYLAKIIPEMLENAFKIALDPMFPPQIEHKKFKTWVEDSNFINRFELIFNSSCCD